MYGCSKFFDTVPRELEEAAILDGCSRFKFSLELCYLSLPAIAVTALFSFLAAWNEFLLALTFNTSNDMYTLPVGLASMISSTGQSWRFRSEYTCQPTSSSTVHHFPTIPRRGIVSRRGQGVIPWFL